MKLSSLTLHVCVSFLLLTEQGCGLEMTKTSRRVNGTTFTITGLEEDQEYSVEVTTVSQAAIGDPAPAINQTTFISSECVCVCACMHI